MAKPNNAMAGQFTVTLSAWMDGPSGIIYL